MAAHLDACIDIRHIVGVAVDVEDRLANSKPEDCFRVGCYIVEYLGEGIDGGLCSFGLVRGKRSESAYHSAVY